MKISTQKFSGGEWRPKWLKSWLNRNRQNWVTQLVQACSAVRCQRLCVPFVVARHIYVFNVLDLQHLQFTILDCYSIGSILTCELSCCILSMLDLRRRWRSSMVATEVFFSLSCSDLWNTQWNWISSVIRINFNTVLPVLDVKKPQANKHINNRKYKHQAHINASGTHEPAHTHIIIIIIIIIIIVFLEHLSMWNMLNYTEQGEIQKYTAHVHKILKTSCIQTIMLKHPTKQ